MPQKNPVQNSLSPIAPALLQWYHQHRRILPFREDPTPYHIWVSEIMLQQTRVTAVLPYYERFMAELPNIAALAACGEDRLFKLWEGLGYYNRVRNLQKTARIVVAEYGGRLPGRYDALVALPGIGHYTAGAIASIAFGLPEVAVDGNVLRVFSRLLASYQDISLPATKKELTVVVKQQQPTHTPGDYNQALMELGALVCLPGTPKCPQCPLQNICNGYQQGIAQQLPVIAPKKPKTETPVCVFVLRSQNAVVLHKRPLEGLLPGLWEPFLLEGKFTAQQAEEQLRHLFPDAAIAAKLPKAKHVFTHRVWNLYGWQAELPENAVLPASFVFATAAQLQKQYAVPNAFATYLPFMLGKS